MPVVIWFWDKRKINGWTANLHPDYWESAGVKKIRFPKIVYWERSLFNDLVMLSLVALAKDKIKLIFMERGVKLNSKSCYDDVLGWNLCHHSKITTQYAEQ